MYRSVKSPLGDLPHLSQADAKLIERQYLETYVSEKIISDFDFKDIRLSDGRITMLIGNPLSRIPASLLKAATISALNIKPSELQYVDFYNRSDLGRTAYRVEHIYEISGEQAKKTIHSALTKINTNIAAHKKIYDIWSKVAKKVTFYKNPNASQANSSVLIAGLNLRKQSIPHLARKLEVSNEVKVVIGDMDTNSVFDLGSREHFGLNSLQTAIEGHRKFLSKIESIIEQRVLCIEDSEKVIVLARSCNVSDIMNRLCDKSTSIKSIMREAAHNLTKESWLDVLHGMKERNSELLSETEWKELEVKAIRQDNAYQKATQKFIGEAYSHKLVSKEKYILNVRREYSQSEILESYRAVFETRPGSDLSDNEDLKAFFERDWRQGKQTNDFVFPECAMPVNDRPEVQASKSNDLTMRVGF